MLLNVAGRVQVKLSFIGDDENDDVCIGRNAKQVADVIYLFSILLLPNIVYVLDYFRINSGNVTFFLVRFMCCVDSFFYFFSSSSFLLLCFVFYSPSSSSFSPSPSPSSSLSILPTGSST